ncbi:hypothetical protein [Glycomyces xiaoerkulensis]|uniref:hypothetical protein n=1 Tax=Glycomyces xiaoerkulensis TaxID=2038139 RepID=UPI0013000468|nr:hypothetical protein [Glycomyces xiaoerkulensis]
MAGTLGFKLAVRHTYQRRFTRQDLDTALAGCHWYLISARPAVRIIPDSERLDDGILTVGFQEAGAGDSSGTAALYGAEYADTDHDATFHVHEGGSYFSLRFPGVHLHGDSWSLAAFLSGGGPDLARHEILYIGKAYGDGRRTAATRTAQHETLQTIYEDYLDQRMDIFVTPLMLAKSTWSSDDHIDDTEPGPDIDAYERVFATRDGVVSGSTVDLIEHSLIAHFSPAYNVNLSKWQAPRQTEPMRQMRSAGFRLLNVHLDTSDGLARFCSATQPEARRSHFIYHDVPPAPRKAVPRGISAMEISQWRPEARLVREGPDMFSDLAEQRDLMFRTFGDEAPAERKPSSIFLDHSSDTTVQTTPLAPDLLEAEQQVRESILQRRQQEADEEAALQYRGVPTYDPETGSIEFGRLDSGEPVPWILHDREGNAQSGYLINDDHRSNTSTLVILKHQAELSGRFVTYLCDPKDRLRLSAGTDASSPQAWIATSPDATAEAILKVADVVDLRAGDPGDFKIGSGTAGLLLVINDADTILGSPAIDRAASNILTNGPVVGVGLLTAFGTVTGFTYAAEHWQGLGGVHNKLAGIEVPPSLPAWAAMLHRAPLQEVPVTDGELAFAVFHDDRNLYFGIVAGVLDGSHDGEAVKREGRAIIVDLVGGDLLWIEEDHDCGCYEGLNLLNATRWIVRRFPEQWVLFHVMTNYFFDVDAPQHEALGWADEVMRSRFRTPAYTWRSGPTPDGTDFALYTTIPEPIEVLDQSNKIMQLYRHLYG